MEKSNWNPTGKGIVLVKSINLLALKSKLVEAVTLRRSETLYLRANPH